ncbi:MAG: DUF2007 domain-containing protein [Treponema sp.]|nr:DUF2007 domain-containing protein [Treponema sp.]
MYLIIFIILVIFVFVLYLRFRKPQSQALLEAQKSDEEKSLEEMNFEKEFFERSKAGERSQLFMSIASQQDCLMLRSLLYSEGIPTYVEGEHMNNVYGGITGTMTTVVAIKLYILCQDYDKTKEIVENSNITDLSGITIFKKEEEL